VKRTLYLALCLAALSGCGSHVHFIQIDPGFEPAALASDAGVSMRRERFRRPHRVVGIIEAELGRDARRIDLDALLIGKAREIGADGLMLVEYDVDRDVYVERHSRGVGRGPWRHHVVRARRRVDVDKRASAVAVVFE